MFDPLTYGMDGLRGAFIGLSHSGLMTDAAVLAIVAGAFLVLGAYAFRVPRSAFPVLGSPFPVQRSWFSFRPNVEPER
jgi:hypothetical protein